MKRLELSNIIFHKFMLDVSAVKRIFITILSFHYDFFHTFATGVLFLFSFISPFFPSPTLSSRSLMFHLFCSLFLLSFFLPPVLCLFSISHSCAFLKICLLFCLMSFLLLQFLLHSLLALYFLPFLIFTKFLIFLLYSCSPFWFLSSFYFLFPNFIFSIS